MSRLGHYIKHAADLIQSQVTEIFDEDFDLVDDELMDVISKNSKERKKFFSSIEDRKEDIKVKIVGESINVL